MQNVVIGRKIHYLVDSPCQFAIHSCVADVAIRRVYGDRSIERYSFKEDFDEHGGVLSLSVWHIKVITVQFYDDNWQSFACTKNGDSTVGVSLS